MARRKFREETFDVFCWCGAKATAGLAYEGAYKRCPQHGVMKMNDPGYRIQKTSHGDIVVVTDLQVLDANPDLLVADLPVCLEEELAIPMSAADRKFWWDRRVRAIADERRLRAENAKRDVYAGDKALREAAR